MREAVSVCVREEKEEEEEEGEEGEEHGGDEGGDDDDDGLVCVICLSEVETGETVRLLPRCGHRFHAQACVDVWLRQHNNCPICKAHVIVGPIGGGSRSEV